MKSGSELSSHNLADALLSPLKRLTTEFGMGSGRTTTHKPPGDKYIVLKEKYQGINKHKLQHLNKLPRL
jgi:hypothetical protein